MFNTFEQQFGEALDNMQLDLAEKTIVLNRYVKLVTTTRRNSFWISVLFLSLTNMITIGGVIIVAFLTLEKVTLFGEQAAQALFWTSLTISIAVTVANKLLYSFSIAKKYLFNGALLAKYESEGWSFVSGVGRYNVDMTTRVKLFTERIERLYIKSVEIMTTMDGAATDKDQQHTAIPRDNTQHDLGANILVTGSGDHITRSDATRGANPASVVIPIHDNISHDEAHGESHHMSPVK